MKFRSISVLALFAGLVILAAIYLQPEPAEANRTNYLSSAPRVRVTLDARYTKHLRESGSGDFLTQGQVFSAQFIGFEAGYAVFSLGNNSRLLYLVEREIIMMEVMTY